MSQLLTYFECDNFIHQWRGLLFKIGSEREIFNKIYLFTLSVFARRKSLEEYFFIFRFFGVMGFETCTHTIYLFTHKARNRKTNDLFFVPVIEDKNS